MVYILIPLGMVINLILLNLFVYIMHRYLFNVHRNYIDQNNPAVLIFSWNILYYIYIIDVFHNLIVVSVYASFRASFRSLTLNIKTIKMRMSDIR